MHNCKENMNSNIVFNPFGAYLSGALKAAFASYFVGGIIPEQQIDMVKEVLLRFKEAEIDHHSELSMVEKEKMKRQWEQWLDATTKGVKDEFKAEGKLG